jgi:hypothetical protein
MPEGPQPILITIIEDALRQQDAVATGALANLQIAGTHRSFAGFIVFPPQDQAENEAQAAGSEDEGARDRNG